MKQRDPKNRQLGMWMGISLLSWIRLLARNRFAIHITRLPMILIVSISSSQHSLLGFFERVLFARRIARSQIHPSPVFILGHWRSGTTLLHELLDCDPRLRCPTTYECCAPLHFLLTRHWIPRMFAWSLPTKRPMDNMAVGWNKPQEDEFALCLLGQPSIMEHVAFPNRHGPSDPQLRIETLSPVAQRRWKHAFLRLLKRLTIGHEGKPPVLKSPPHTFRVPLLLELFPHARFIHIVRNPYDVYASTLHLWRAIYALNSLQRPTWRGLEHGILATYEAMYERFEIDRKQIPLGRLVEIQFEKLLADPERELESIYGTLGLGDFEPARAKVQAYLQSVRGYEQNRLMVTPEEKQLIAKRWGRYFAAHYGGSQTHLPECRSEIEDISDLLS